MAAKQREIPIHPDKTTEMKTTAISLTAFFVMIVFMSGCAANKDKRTDSLPVKQPDTIRAEVVRQISKRVLTGIPVEGRLSEVKKRGILKVALFPDDERLQRLDANFKVPVGFNPALTSEIAGILEVKPNITILGATEASGGWRSDFGEKYDLVFLPEGRTKCPEKNQIPYFYTGASNSWKKICVSDSDGAFTSAVKEILIYLNETGIFAQLYKTHVDG